MALECKVIKIRPGEIRKNILPRYWKLVGILAECDHDVVWTKGVVRVLSA